jgi:hypothetical protein
MKHLGGGGASYIRLGTSDIYNMSLHSFGPIWSSLSSTCDTYKILSSDFNEDMRSHGSQSCDAE